jgi:hypothetical protein
MRKTWSVPVFVWLAACAGPGVPGTYHAMLPAASGGAEREVRVTLHGDGRAALTSAFMDRPSRFLAEGTWQASGSEVVVSLERERLVFRRAGDQLQTREWDRALWGEAGPGTLFRVR